jgi:signal transduction histidine kinase/CheY-like chemotaxis protein
VNLCEIWTDIQPVPIASSMYDVFDIFREHPEWPFLPVVDEDAHVIGVVREFDLKGYAYGRFGRELIRYHPLQDFLKPTLVLALDVPEKTLLDSSAKNPNPDGLVLTDRGRYRATLLNRAVLRLFEQQHLEAEMRLAQAQKMEAIGTLAGGIAHDLNNILTPILGYAELMSYLRKHDEPIEQDVIDQIIVSAMRAREVVKHILAFSRHQETERCPMSLGDVVKDAVRLIGSSLPATIDIEMRLNAQDDRIMANADEIHRVIMNLLANAYHSMRGHEGRLQVTLDRHTGPMLGWSMHTELMLGDYLRLSISDTGTGIDPCILPRIFEPFFTTKTQSEGTGLGLSVVHGILSRCKGMVSVESIVGQGSTFHLYIPSLAEETARSAGAAPTAEAPDADTRRPAESHYRMAEKILPKYGISVVTENDSNQALLTFRTHATDFDLLVTDQTMPGFTGVDLTKEVLQIRPGLPVILCTGYSEEVSPEQAREIGVCEYLQKPIDYQQMATSIKKLIRRH